MSKSALKSQNVDALREQRKRFRRAQVTADIEGLARNNETAVLRERWMVDGVPVAEQIARLKAYYSKTG